MHKRAVSGAIDTQSRRRSSSRRRPRSGIARKVAMPCASKRTAQRSFVQARTRHHLRADATEAISAWVDQHPLLCDAIAADPNVELGSARGRRGFRCETCLRGAVLKPLSQDTWRGPDFSLRDSISACRFARVDEVRVLGLAVMTADDEAPPC